MSPTQLPLPQATSAPAAPPVFGQAPQGKKPKQKSAQPTFLGSDALPQQMPMGSKTLLGS